MASPKPISERRADRPSERSVHARRLFAGLPATYDVMAEVLSFGQNGRWRRFLVSRIPLQADARELDVATGTGRVAIDVIRRWDARVEALDQSEPMLRRARVRVGRAGVGDRIRFVLGTAEGLPFADESFDAVTFTYLLRYVDDPGRTLRELSRVLRPGGTLGNLEFHVPSTPPWRTLWRLYTGMVLPVAGRVVSKPWYEVGRFLGPSISQFYRRLPLPAQLGLWREAGIADVQARVMSLGGGVVVWGRKAPAA